jgi:hypothetical protein
MTWILRLWEACCTRHAEMQQCDHAEMLQLQWRWAVIGCAAYSAVLYCRVKAARHMLSHILGLFRYLHYCLHYC